MRITPIISNRYQTNFKSNNNNNKFPEIESHNKDYKLNFNKMQVGNNTPKANKDTFTHKSIIGGNTHSNTDYTNLLYSRIFLY